MLTLALKITFPLCCKGYLQHWRSCRQSYSFIHSFLKFVCTVIIYYLLTWGYPLGLYWALSPRFVSDPSAQEVNGRVKG